MEEMKDKVLEIADIAKSCPDNLQVACFETLLKHYLSGLQMSPGGSPEAARVTGVQAGTENQPNVDAEARQKQDELRDADFHLKFKRFMKNESVPLEDLNELFYKEGEEIHSLYEDLKTTKEAEGQIRITLMQALRNAMGTGEFEADVESVRQDCKARKCYNGPNFTATFRNNKALFDFEKFEKSTKSVRLSETGKKELGKVVKKLVG